MRHRRIWTGSPLGFTRDGTPFSYDGNAPTLIFGPPGSMKSVAYFINELLNDDGKRSYLVLDPKGELAAITARWRRKVGKVKIINPYGVLGFPSDGWNPLGDLDGEADGFADECAAKGDALIKTDANEQQKHFPDSARSAITGTIMWEVRDAKKKGLPPSLANVRRLLTQDTASLKAWLDTLLPDADLDIKSRLAKFLDDTNEVASIKSTIETQTSWMSSRPMRNDMAVAEGVDFRDLKKEPTTVYVILPTKELQSKATFLRLVLSSALRDIYQDGGVPCTLLVDEGFVLGHHGELESAAAILRGYFSRFSISFQSLSQASKLYSRNWETFAGGAILGFRPASNETAEWMSKRWEQYSTPVRSVGDPSGVTDFKRRDSWKPERRETISPAQMLTMPAGFAMAQRPNEPPRIVRVKGYFEIPLLARRADPNPYYQAPRKRAWFFF